MGNARRRLRPDGQRERRPRLARNPANNFGWLLLNTDEASASTLRAFCGRDVATTAFHLQLAIIYAAAPTPEPSGLALALCGGMASFAAVVRKRP